MSTPRPLERLLSERPDLWRGRRRRPQPAVATGRAALDRQLPTGGWPCGKLTELVVERHGSGELDLLLPCLAEMTKRDRPVLFIDPPMVPCPQALAGAGMDLTRLVVVRRDAHALWAAEQCLKSGLCGAVVVWPPRREIGDRAVRRLQLAAESGDAPVFLCYPPGSTPPASLSALRLAVRPGGRIEVLRGAYGAAPAPVTLHADNVVPLRGREAGTAERRT